MAFSGIESGNAEAPPTHFKWYVRNVRKRPKAAAGVKQLTDESSHRRPVPLQSTSLRANYNYICSTLAPCRLMRPLLYVSLKVSRKSGAIQSISSVIDHKVTETITELSAKEVNLSESIQSAEDRLNNLFKASEAAIALSAPVKYWEDRKKLHKESAQKYGIFSLISGVIFAITLGTVIVNEYSAGLSYSFWIYSLTLPKSISGIALILLISTAGIWSTRIFVKLMMANLTLESESLERATMIKTFVAMKAVESSMAQEAELLFYTTLFRPSNNVINEESTAPEFGKLLDAVLKAKSDKADA